MRRPGKVRVQAARRAYDGACLLCGQGDPAALDAHRLSPGSRYIWAALVTLCCCCHRRWHAGQVAFLGRHPGPAGWVLRLAIAGGETFVPQSRREMPAGAGSLWDAAPSSDP